MVKSYLGANPNRMTQQRQDTIRCNINACKEVLEEENAPARRSAAAQHLKNRERSRRAGDLVARPSTVFALIQKFLASDGLRERVDCYTANLARLCPVEISPIEVRDMCMFLQVTSTDRIETLTGRAIRNCFANFGREHPDEKIRNLMTSFMWHSRAVMLSSYSYDENNQDRLQASRIILVKYRIIFTNAQLSDRFDGAASPCCSIEGSSAKEAKELKGELATEG